MTDDPPPTAAVRPTAASTPSARAECVAGAAGGLATLASVLTLGLLAFAALGPQAAAQGIPASFVATVIGGSLFAWLARGPMPAGGPSSAMTLILAALVAEVAGDPAFRAGDAHDTASLLALTAAAVVGMGALQIAFALAGLARAAKYIAHPVLAGFMNGVAIVFVVSQLPTLFGWTTGAWAASRWSAFAHVQPATLAVGILTVATIATWPRIARSPLLPPWFRTFAGSLPGAFAGLVVGCAAYAAIAALDPSVPLGGVVGSVPPAWPVLDRLAPLAHGAAGGDGLLVRHAGAAATTAVLLALIGTLDLVLNQLALDQALHTRTDARRELIALGVANVASGAVGGLPLLLVRARALATWRGGGRTPLSLWFGNALYALLALLGAPLLAALPKAVLGGIMVMIGILLFDAWSLGLVARWLRGESTRATRLDLALVAIVCAASVVWGFAVGVGIGALRAVVLFVRGMNRSLVRVRREGSERPSRRIYQDAHEAFLRDVRPSIAILELEGALFFGSADRLVREVDALDARFRTIVMDLHRVTLIDASGAIVLSQIRRRLAGRGVALLLAGIAVGERRGDTLVACAGDALPTGDWHADVDRAVERAELGALARAALPPVDAPVPLARSALAAGLDIAQCGRLAAHLGKRSLAVGERLFSAGDAGDALFVLMEGSISVIGGGVRYVTCSPGMIFGEIALLDGRGRSADAIADAASIVQVLDADALRRLEADDASLAAAIYRNIALHLSTRLRLASGGAIAADRATVPGATVNAEDAAAAPAAEESRRPIVVGDRADLVDAR